MSYDFKFAGVALSELFGVTTERPDREIALYDGELVSISGRSGDVYNDNKRYKNVVMMRKIGFGHRALARTPETVGRLISWLGYNQGYHEFEDTDHPGLVTYAAITNFEKVQTFLSRFHTAPVKFSRVPFWFEKDSLNPIVLSTWTEMSHGVKLFNPYPVIAQPVIEVVLKTTATSSDSFQIKFGSKIVTYNLSDFPIGSGENFKKNIFFDSETQETRIQKTEAGEGIEFVDIDPEPGIPPGNMTIQLYAGWTNAVDSMKITPRWRCL